MTTSTASASHPYDGPFIDSHHHLWDLSGDNHPWLRASGAFGPPGRFDPLKGMDYLLDDYRADIAGTGVVGSVHVEALWERGSPVDETVWLESLPEARKEAVRYIAAADFGAPDAEAVIRRQAAFERVKGIRQVIAWTPDPRRRMADRPDITDETSWRAHLPLLVREGLLLELLMYPWQSDNVCRLATTYPSLRIVIDHIGSPVDSSPEGFQRWRAGMKRLAERPNVIVKLSAAAAYPRVASAGAMRPYVDALLESFGAHRLMWGSDFPVAKLVGWSFARYLDAYRDNVADLSTSEQRAIFFATAAQVYDFD